MDIEEVFIDPFPGCENIVPAIVTPSGSPSATPIDPSVRGHPKKSIGVVPLRLPSACKTFYSRCGICSAKPGIPEG